MAFGGRTREITKGHVLLDFEGMATLAEVP
jgi:hypothetical protein